MNLPSENLKKIADIVSKTPYTEEYVSLLVRRKKIPGKKIGKTWFVREDDVQKYIALQKTKLEQSEFIISARNPWACPWVSITGVKTPTFQGLQRKRPYKNEDA